MMRARVNRGRLRPSETCFPQQLNPIASGKLACASLLVRMELGDGLLILFTLASG